MLRVAFRSSPPVFIITLQTDKALNEIHLSPHRQDTICIQGVGDQKSAPQISQEVVFYLHTNSSTLLKISAATLPIITPHTFPFEIDQIKNKIPKLNTLQYADSQPHLPITLLLGNSHMWPLIESIEVLHENVFLINTSIGYMIAGEGIKTLLQPTLKLHTSFHSTPQNLWDLESIGINTKGLAETEAELKALQLFYASTEKIGERYQVRWPWIESPPPLANNYNLAIARLKGQIKKLKDSTDFFQRYNQYFADLAQRQIVEQVSTERPQNTISHYLPPKGSWT